MDQIEEDAMNQHDYRCSAYGSSQDLAIRAHIWTAPVADGFEPDSRTRITTIPRMKPTMLPT